LIDHDVHFEGSKRVLQAPTAERMKVIHDLVAAAAGFNMERGDQLIVESLPFEATMNLEPPAASGPATAAGKKTPLEQLKGDPKMMIGLAGGGILIVGAVIFVFIKMAKKPKQIQVQTKTPQVAGQRTDVAQVAAASTTDTWSPSSAIRPGEVPALAPARVEVLTNQIRAAAQQDSEICVGVLRGWLSGERA
jgi:flagellar M-ring protein FliF